MSVALEDFQDRTKICVNLKLLDKIQPWLQESIIFANQLTKVGNSGQASARARRVNLKVDTEDGARDKTKIDSMRVAACDGDLMWRHGESRVVCIRRLRPNLMAGVWRERPHLY